MDMYESGVGSRVVQIDTPSLLVDLDVFEANLARMSEFLRQGSTKLRPHSKSNKCPVIAQKQVAAGAIGICCQKLGEAEVMASHGIRDILITNQIVGPIKIARLMAVARGCDLKVAVDNPGNVDALAEAASAARLRLGVVIEVNVGMNRCGVLPGEPTVELARHIMRRPSLQFRGLMGYEGHCVDLPDFQERKTQTEKAMALLVQTRDAVQAANIEVDIVSGGGTGTYMITGRYPGITEIEAGSYVFMDTTYRQALTDFDNSLTVLSTVISRPANNRVVLDCGVKTLAGDYGTPAIEGVRPALSCGLSEEHSTWVYDSNMQDLAVGDKVRVIPAHCCATINLHDRLFAVRREVVEDIWEIAGCGKTR